MSEMTSIWQKIEVWYAENGASHLLNPGASEAEITATEKSLNVTFPPELRESLRRHNGSTEDGWVTGELLSLEGIESEHAMWTELLNDGAFDINASINAGNEEVQSGWWYPAWIPLDADGGVAATVVSWTRPPALLGQSGRCVIWITRLARKVRRNLLPITLRKCWRN